MDGLVLHPHRCSRRSISWLACCGDTALELWQYRHAVCIKSAVDAKRRQVDERRECKRQKQRQA